MRSDAAGRAMNRRSLRRSTLLLTLALVIMVAAVAARTRVTTTSIDDTYIFCRYALHLAHGQGLVWNVGDPPVEGFTSPLWVFVLALVSAAGLDPAGAAVVLAVAAWGGTIILAWWLCGRLCGSGVAVPAAVAFVLALSAIGIFWAGTGMDEALFALTVLGVAAAAVAFQEGRLEPAPFALLLLVLCLARPEGLAIAGVLLAAAVVPGAIRPRALRATGIFAGGVVVLFVARWLTFHALLPNTYYAKSGGGLVQLRAGLVYAVSNWPLWLPGLAAAPFVLRRDRRYLPLVLTAGALTLAIVLEGGDQFSRARFFLPVLSLSVLLVAGLLPRRRLLAALTASALALLTLPAWWASAEFRPVLAEAIAGLGAWHAPWQLVQVAPPPRTDRIVFLQDLEAGFVIMGKTLARVAPPGSSIAAVPIGAIGWYSGCRVIDMVGLVNPTVAHAPIRLGPGIEWRPGHNRGDGAAILAARPDFIQLQDALSSRPAPRPHPFMMHYLSVAEIWSSPEFWAHYEFFPIRTQSGWYYDLYRRKDGPAAGSEAK